MKYNITLKNFIRLFIIIFTSFIFYKLYKCRTNSESFDKMNSDNFFSFKNKFYDKGSKIFTNYKYSDEIPERLSVFFFLEEDDKVLEIGGNIGGVSEVIAKIINNPKNLVVIEPSDIAVKTLNEISKNNGSFHIYNGALVCNNINLDCKVSNDGGNYFKCEKVNYKVNNNITYEELQNKYNIEFNVLVIDCEGCYEMFLRYGFENKMFDKIKKIFIEWDGIFEEDIILKNGFVLVGMFIHRDLQKGNRVYYKI